MTDTLSDIDPRTLEMKQIINNVIYSNRNRELQIDTDVYGGAWVHTATAGDGSRTCYLRVDNHGWIVRLNHLGIKLNLGAEHITVAIRNLINLFLIESGTDIRLVGSGRQVRIANGAVVLTYHSGFMIARPISMATAGLYQPPGIEPDTLRGNVTQRVNFAGYGAGERPTVWSDEIWMVRPTVQTTPVGFVITEVDRDARSVTVTSTQPDDNNETCEALAWPNVHV